jgi:hypothetical protein
MSKQNELPEAEEPDPLAAALLLATLVETALDKKLIGLDPILVGPVATAIDIVREAARRRRQAIVAASAEAIG